MPRTRSLRPGFFKNEQLCGLPPLVRLLFAGLWTLADRDGRLLDRPKLIKSELFPYDTLDVDRALSRLAACGFIMRYERDGQRCIQVHNWHKHQRPHPREDVSVVPAPEGYVVPPVVNPGYDPEPDLGAPPATARPRPGQPSSSSSSSSSFPSRNSLREDPPTPQGGRRSKRRNGLTFDENGTEYVQRIGADGKREWVAVDS
jgi:hypothetical protein